MIVIEKTKVINKLLEEEPLIRSGYTNLEIDLMEKKGDQTVAFLIKRGLIKFKKEELERELNIMVEDSLLTIGQWEQMIELLKNARNGEERISNFLRKKRRFEII